MSELPTGTVSLLFSDIEGSTVLLKRLGPAYADALDSQRQVLRKAWAEHGGIELGTEGDSFYVVFPTAEGAVAAGAQAQRELAAFEWPAGERVRVRMGIHTGSPAPHDGAYVGMDVHRAARIAGAAHGGQVLISEVTEKLVTGCLPDGVAVKDLGSHQLKDMPSSEHLFQLVIGGLVTDFPPPKTLGASSSLPRPATPLVGRDGEVAELTALLGSPEVRLVTLTGPGGSGKTRLGIAVAQQMVERFPDGVFFVPLAAVPTSDVMWTTIAEVLDVPPEGRIPPGFFDHVAHRSALFVLDNLEQIVGADTVVAELLDHAPQAVAVATSRKPLAVAAQHVHPVPPLELPDDDTVEQAQASGAVQLFVQHARKVKPSFALTADNARDVTAVCRRLDGLPLAIELAAARTRLLTPKALLGRLDQALDLKASAVDSPTRQRTLRDTIAWSYDLLSPTQQRIFRRLGVFSGGADLDAIEAVTVEILGEADPLDVVADLVDASLVTIGEDIRGEPRVGMSETIRAFALEQLGAAGEAETAQRDHAEHYAGVVGQLEPLLSGGADRVLHARSRFELDHDNIREAVRWALGVDATVTPAADRLELGLSTCSQLWRFWIQGGYYAEGRDWLERLIETVGGQDSIKLSVCLNGLSFICRTQGDIAAAVAASTRSVAMSRRLDDKIFLPAALRGLGVARLAAGERAAGVSALEEAVAVARELNDRKELALSLTDLARAQALEGNYERTVDLLDASLALHAELGDELSGLLARHNLACTLRMMGRPEDAYRNMRQQIPQMVRLAAPDLLIAVAEDYSCVLAELGRRELAAQLLGAADAMRKRNQTPRDLSQESEIAGPLATARAALTADEWVTAYQTGGEMTVEEALTQAHANHTPT